MSQAQQFAFESLKSRLVQPPVLAHYDLDLPTIVTCDASAVALGAVLSQLHENGERPVAFASTSLSAAEKKYSAGERESLACVWACEHWHIFLFGRAFTLRTDHQALTTLLATTGSGHRPLRIYRWSDRLHQYKFSAEYKPGRENSVADALSRLPTKTATAVTSDITSEDENFIREVMQEAIHEFITPDELRTATLADPILVEVLQQVRAGWQKKPDNDYLRQFYNLRDELWIWNNDCLARGQRAVIPAELQASVLHMAHQGHQGVVRAKQRCREAVYWPGIDSHIEAYIKDCEACLVSEKSIKWAKAPLQPITWPSKPWEKLQLDIFGEIHVAPQDSRFLLVITDLHSKWPEISASQHITTATVTAALSDLFARWGLCKEIITDNGPQFASQEYKDFLQRHGIKDTKTARYHPESNGQVERFNQVVKNGLKMHLAEGLSVRKAVQTILQSYRATPHALTGKSPAELMLGRKLVLPLEVLKPTSASGDHPLDKMI